MKKRFTYPQLLFRFLGACSIGLFVSFFPATAMAASNADACSLLKPADLTGLLGGAAKAKNNAGSCAWTTSGSKKKLIVIAHKQLS